SKATPLHNDILTTGPWVITTRLYGVQTILVASEDTTGNQSTPAFTVLDFGQPDTSNAVASRDYGALRFPGAVTNGSVSGTSLVATADAASDRYALADLYGEADNYATSYLPLTWVSDAFIPPFQGGTVTLNQAIQGSSSLVEYQ